MHSAPAVSYPVGRSVSAAALATAAWMAGVTTAGLWWWQADAPGWRQALSLLTLGVTGAWAGWSWWRAAAGELAWDGHVWHWSCDPAAPAASVAVSLDLQRVLLVQWRGGGTGRRVLPWGGQWLWLERTRAPARWDALRRAVYSRAIPDALPRSEPPAAKP